MQFGVTETLAWSGQLSIEFTPIMDCAKKCRFMANGVEMNFR